MKDWIKSGKAEPKTAAGIFFWCLAAVLAVRSLFLCFGGDIWYDELFTEGLISGTVWDLLRLDARDVHPPLYYLLVKGAADLVHLLWPAASAVAVSKVMSVLPFFGLLVYGALWVRKRYGWLSAGLFAFCIMSMPQMANYTTEVRMYGWALFFVTAAFLHGGEILMGKPSSGKSVAAGHWAAFILYGICAAYTHYFAAVATFFCILFWPPCFCGVRIKRDGGGICVCGSSAPESPWLPGCPGCPPPSPRSARCVRITGSCLWNGAASAAASSSC